MREYNCLMVSIHDIRCALINQHEDFYVEGKKLSQLEIITRAVSLYERIKDCGVDGMVTEYAILNNLKLIGMIDMYVFFIK